MERLRVLVQGMERIGITQFVQTEPYIKAKVNAKAGQVGKIGADRGADAGSSRALPEDGRLTPNMPEELSTAALNIEDPRQLAYLVATNIRLELPAAPGDPGDRERVRKDDQPDAAAEPGGRGAGTGQEDPGPGQGPDAEGRAGVYLLRQQLSAIRKELGEESEEGSEVKSPAREDRAAKLPPEAEKEAKRELPRMEKLNADIARVSVIRTYLEWMTGPAVEQDTRPRPSISQRRGQRWTRITTIWKR